MKVSVYKNFNPSTFKITLLIIFGFSAISINAQQTKIDSLKQLISVTKDDTLKINLFESLGQAYRDAKKIDSSILSYQQALEINQKINYSVLRQCYNMGTIDYLLYVTGNYAKSLEYASKVLVLSEKIKDVLQIAHAHLVFGHNYIAMGNYRQALNHYFTAKTFFESYQNPKNDLESPMGTIQFIGDVYFQMGEIDSAFFFTRQAYEMAIAMTDEDPGGAQYHKDYSFRIFGNIYLAKGNDQLALNYYRQFISDFYKYNLNNREIGHVYYNIARIFEKRKETDSTVYYAKNALEAAKTYQDEEHLYKAAIFLYNLYKSTNEHQAFFYYKIASEARDSLINIDKTRQVGILAFDEQIREKEKQEADAKEAARTKLIIIISALIVSIATFLIWNRIRQLKLRHTMILEQKEAEKLKAKYEKELLRMEAKALRAQMNPHFIFNCLNSIKSLIQQNENEKSATYLTTFSKLIRTLLNNADKKEISLYDEIETCKLYLQLEAMRFDTKFSYSVNVDENIDLKSIHVPALIIQPFIENAIWHGIVPRNNGGNVSLNVVKKNEFIEVIIDDDGIGRETSQQNKSVSGLAHQSKGVNLTQSRLELNNLLQQRQAKLEIIDNKDEKGIATGTTVIIKIKEEA